MTTALHWRPIIASLVIAGGSLATAVSPAAATYPGASNGRLAFAIKDAAGNAQVSTVMPDGTDVKTLTSGAHFHACTAYSADGSKLAYCSDASGAFEIWTMNADGSDQTQLTNIGGFATFPDFSPDGMLVAFTGTSGPDSQVAEVFTVDTATGATVSALTSCKGGKPGCNNDFPAWSPDGTQIAYIHVDDTVNDNPVGSQVWVMNADGSNPRQLTTDAPIKDQLPDWSPDGTRIAYHSGPGGSGGIWVMNADGSDQHQLIGCKATDPAPCASGDYGAPAWSPDGQQVAFLSFPADPADRPVMVMNADGSNPHRVIAGPSIDFAPAWQPVETGTPSASAAEAAGSPAASETSGSATVAVPAAVLDFSDTTSVIHVVADGEDVVIGANGAFVHVDGQTNAETRVTAPDVRNGDGPFALAPDGIWIGSYSRNLIERLDAATGRVELTASVSAPSGFEVVGDHVWVALHGDSGLYPVDPATGKLGTKITGGVTNSSRSLVTRFDPVTLMPLATIAVPEGSGCGFFSRSLTGELWTGCSVFQWGPSPDGATVVGVDPDTNLVKDVVTAPNFSAALVVDDALWFIAPRDLDDGTIASSLVIIDAASGRTTATWDLGPLDADIPVLTATALWIPDEQGHRVLKFDRAAIALSPAAVAGSATSERTLTSRPSPATSSASAGTSALKIGLVTDAGTITDGAINQASWDGAVQAATRIGAAPPTALHSANAQDIQNQIGSLLDAGANVIVSVGYAADDWTVGDATRHPDVQFIGVDQSPATALPNLQGITWDQQQAGYLAGIVAGSISRTGHIAAIGREDSPWITNYMVGFRNGALSVNPTIRVELPFVTANGTWEDEYDPAAGKAVTEALFASSPDVDVVLQAASGDYDAGGYQANAAGTTGAGILEAACARSGVYAIGVDVDQHLSLSANPAATKCLVTSAMKFFATSVSSAIVRVADGTATGGTFLQDLSNGGVGLAPFYDFQSLITPDIQARIDAATAGLMDGSITACAEGADSACVSPPPAS